MTLCPIALVAGCRKCPAFSICPLKGVLGDHVPDKTAPKTPAKRGASGAKRSK